MINQTGGAMMFRAILLVGWLLVTGVSQSVWADTRIELRDGSAAAGETVGYRSRRAIERAVFRA